MLPQVVRVAPQWKWCDDDVFVLVVVHGRGGRCDDVIAKHAMCALAFGLQQPHEPRPLRACIVDRNLGKLQLEY